MSVDTMAAVDDAVAEIQEYLRGKIVALDVLGKIAGEDGEGQEVETLARVARALQDINNLLPHIVTGGS